MCASETPRTSGGKGSWRRRNIRALRRRKRVRFHEKEYQFHEGGVYYASGNGIYDFKRRGSVGRRRK